MRFPFRAGGHTQAQPPGELPPPPRPPTPPAATWVEDFPEFCGVRKFQEDGKVWWLATVTIHGQNQYTETFDTPQEAINAGYALVKNAPTTADVIGQRDLLLEAARRVVVRVRGGWVQGDDLELLELKAAIAKAEKNGR